MTIALIFDVLFGYIGFSFLDNLYAYLKYSGDRPVKPGNIGFAWLVRLRVRPLKYWRPIPRQPRED